MKAAKSSKKTRGPVRIAVAGLGRAGWDIHIKQLRGRRDFTITEVVDLNRKRREEAVAEFGCRGYESWSQFLREGEAEIVVIATASDDHAPMARQALKAGFHVLLEKPMATRWAEVDKLIALAKERRRLLTVHQNLRLRPNFVHISQLVKSGVLGRIFLIKRSHYQFARRNDWQVLRRYGGGQLNNWGVHLVDSVLQLMDSPVEKVFGDLQQIINPGDTEDTFKVVMRSQRGQIADVEMTCACALPLPEWVIMGDKGTLVSEGNTSRLRYFKKRLPRLRPVDKPIVASRAYGLAETIPFQEETMPSQAEPKLNFYDHLYASLRKGKPLFVTPESVRQTMWVLKEARKGTKFA